jgi:hypothetical protein
VVVWAASSTVGSVAAQLAKLKGCRVFGIAGGRKSAITWSTHLASMHASTTLRPLAHSICARLSLHPDRISVAVPLVLVPPKLCRLPHNGERTSRRLA